MRAVRTERDNLHFMEKDSMVMNGVLVLLLRVARIAALRWATHRGVGARAHALQLRLYGGGVAASATTRGQGARNLSITIDFQSDDEII